LRRGQQRESQSDQGREDSYAQVAAVVSADHKFLLKAKRQQAGYSLPCFYVIGLVAKT
jgi:hypothetical protein